MPHELTAFLARDRVPDRERLQAAVTALGFELFIHVTYRPFHSSGFLPCALAGRRAGFEIGFETAGLALTRRSRLAAEIGARDCAISLRWGEEMADCACALAIASALAADFGALVHYQETDQLCPADRLIEDARVAADQARAEPAERSPTLLPKRPWWRFW
jgi:hypothetical protein